jgi:ActR/RegA family two-component response regulator
VGRPTDTDFAWLGILAANRPGLGIVLLDSFPRGNTARAAVRAGAAAVLGRPVGLEALVGTLLRLGSRPRNAIGAPGPAD